MQSVTSSIVVLCVGFAALALHLWRSKSSVSSRPILWSFLVLCSLLCLTVPVSSLVGVLPLYLLGHELEVRASLVTILLVHISLHILNAKVVVPYQAFLLVDGALSFGCAISVLVKRRVRDLLATGWLVGGLSYLYLCPGPIPSLVVGLLYLGTQSAACLWSGSKELRRKKRPSTANIARTRPSMFDLDIAVELQESRTSDSKSPVRFSLEQEDMDDATKTILQRERSIRSKIDHLPIYALLICPEVRTALHQKARDMKCEELVLFCLAAREFASLANNADAQFTKYQDIIDTYLKNDAPHVINVSEARMKRAAAYRNRRAGFIVLTVFERVQLIHEIELEVLQLLDPLYQRLKVDLGETADALLFQAEVETKFNT